MQVFMFLLILSVTFVDFFVKTYRLSGLLKFIPELLSAAIFVYVLFAGTRSRFRLVPVKYWIVFGAIVFLIVCGIISNNVGTGPTIAGFRYYARAMPLFFLPAVFDFTDGQLQKQFRLLTSIAIVQVPLAIYQRWTIWDAGRFTGDAIFGTLTTSGILSIALICTVLVLTGMFLRKRIGKLLYISLFFILLIPTTINETKATILFLPIGLFVVLLFGSPPGKRLRIVTMAAILLTAFGAIFFPIYNLMEQNNPYKKDLVGFLTDEKQLDAYLSAHSAGVGTVEQVGRVDAIVIPLEYLSRDPIHFAFGLGIGNASNSSIGGNFIGTYYDIFKSFLITSVSVFILEVGVPATGLILLLYWLVFRDTLDVTRLDRGLMGAFASGWAGVVAVMAISTFYVTTHVFESLSYLYWYFSGLIVARRMHLTLSADV